MQVNRIALCHYRNISSLTCDFHPEANVIYGDNAQGKTNLLESLAFLSTGKSFRGNKESELIQFTKHQARVEGKIFSHQREYALDCQFFLGKRKKLSRNQVVSKKQEEFSQVFQTVLFCPEDLSLVKEGSVLRRRFLDNAISQLRPNYGLALGEYKKLYQHKIQILRKQTDNLLSTLPDFNLRMCQTAAMIVHYRAHFIKRLEEEAPKIHTLFAGGKEEVSLSYKTVSTVENPLVGEKIIFHQIMAHQESHYRAEIASGRCLTGPHKDDVLLSINGLGAKEYGSQGQTRTLALSLKLAEREIFFQETGEYPVLLLDDVLSELDQRRQEFVLNQIKSGQVFITCCQDEKFLQLKDGAKFHIKQGEMR